MGIDASIYQNLKPVQVELPNPMDAAGKALSLSQLGMNLQQMQYQRQALMAQRQAYANSVGPDGQIDRAKYLGQIGQTAPQLLLGEQQKFAAFDKAQGEADTARMQALHQTSTVIAANYGFLLNLYAKDPEAAKSAYPGIRQGLIEQGIPNAKQLPEQMDAGLIAQGYQIANRYKENLDNALTKAKTAEAWANAGPMAQAKLKNEIYGSRGPTNALAGDYNHEMAPIRSSQINMRQMLDSYKNPTPQGDASLVLQNFKIRNPSVPDVNSIEEMKSSQAVPDAWKNKLNQALNGGFDKATRDNLMRDGISAYRANYGTYQDTANRYQQMAADRGVPTGGFTKELALDKTYSEVSALQDKLGPYVPPTERSGNLLGAIKNAASKIAGGEQSASAASDRGPAPQMIRIKGPDGKIYRVPKSMKGAAIANGGSVVK